MPPFFSLRLRTGKVIEEFFKILIDALIIVRFAKKKIFDPGDREAQSREAQLVGKRVPLGQRQRS